MTAMVSPLTNRRYERYCREYLIDQNIAAAYERAGYQPDTGNATRLHYSLEIQIRIAQLENEIHTKLGSTAELVVEGLSRIGYADPRDLYDDGGSFKKIVDMDDDLVMAIDSVEYCPVTGSIEKVKLLNKRGALQDLGKIHGVFNEHEKAGSGEINISISEKDAQL